MKHRDRTIRFAARSRGYCDLTGRHRAADVWAIESFRSGQRLDFTRPVRRELLY
jgi:hypothetical protein